MDRLTGRGTFSVAAIYDKLAQYEDADERGELVRVVRCEDCKYWEQATPNSGNCNRALEITAYANDFCSYGERREETDA